MKKFMNDILNNFSLEMSFISERDDFHPEFSLLQHTLAVIDNVAGQSNELVLAALFHDIGKVFTYAENGNSYGHELTSAWVVGEYHQEISKFADFDKVWWLVRNHLAAGKKIIEGIKSKNDYLLTSHKWWDDLLLLAKADDMLDDSGKNLDMFLGKRIFVSSDNDYFAGICTYIGFNKFLGTKQVTIDLSPIRLDNYNLVCSYFAVLG